MSPIVRGARPADSRQVGAMLARAFADDPVTSWVTPSGARRPATLRRLYTAIARFDAIPFATVWVAVEGETIEAAAIWRAPRRPASPRAVPFALAAGWALGTDIPRMTRAGVAVARARPRGDHWYLQLLGVDPSRQRSGAGSALMEHVLALVDADGMPACLETTIENLDFYARFGFAVRSEIIVCRGAPAEFGLVRRPGRQPDRRPAAN
jgi:GNAT superfamily N-acetyltransferase